MWGMMVMCLFTEPTVCRGFPVRFGEGREEGVGAGAICRQFAEGESRPAGPFFLVVGKGQSQSLGFFVTVSSAK